MPAPFVPQTYQPFLDSKVSKSCAAKIPKDAKPPQFFGSYVGPRQNFLKNTTLSYVPKPIKLN
jgi:hypothetical protein